MRICAEKSAGNAAAKSAIMSAGHKVEDKDDWAGYMRVARSVEGQHIQFSLNSHWAVKVFFSLFPMLIGAFSHSMGPRRLHV